MRWDSPHRLKSRRCSQENFLAKLPASLLRGHRGREGKPNCATAGGTGSHLKQPLISIPEIHCCFFWASCPFPRNVFFRPNSDPSASSQNGAPRLSSSVIATHPISVRRTAAALVKHLSHFKGVNPKFARPDLNVLIFSMSLRVLSSRDSV